MKKYFMLTAVAVSAAFYAQTHNLKLNLEQGKTYQLMQNVAMDMEQKVGGQTIPVKINGSVGMQAKVLEAKADVYKLETTYSYILSEVEGAGQKMTFESNSETDNEMNEMLGKMVNKPFVIEMSSDGTIKSITGNDKIMESLQKEFSGNNAQAAEQLISIYSTEKLKETFQMVYSFPKKPVKIGEQWNNDFVSKSNYPVSNKNVYKLVSADDSVYTIDYSSDLQTLPGSVMEQNGMKMMPNLKGKSTGVIKLDKKSGWISDFTSAGEMRGDVTMIDMGNMKVDMTMKTNMKYYPQATLTKAGK